MARSGQATGYGDSAMRPRSGRGCVLELMPGVRRLRWESAPPPRLARFGLTVAALVDGHAGQHLVHVAAAAGVGHLSAGTAGGWTAHINSKDRCPGLAQHTPRGIELSKARSGRFHFRRISASQRASAPYLLNPGLVKPLLPLALTGAVLVGCSGPQAAPAPSQPEPFCTSARAFNTASLEAAKQAATNGSISNGNLGAEYSQLLVPLQQLQADLPQDAPTEVRTAVTAYMNELTALSGGSSLSDPLDAPPQELPGEAPLPPQEPVPPISSPDAEAVPSPEVTPGQTTTGAQFQGPTPPPSPSDPVVSPMQTAAPDPSAPAVAPPIPEQPAPDAGVGTVVPGQDPSLLTWAEAASAVAGYIGSRCPSSATAGSPTSG